MQMSRLKTTINQIKEVGDNMSTMPTSQSNQGNNKLETNNLEIKEKE